MPTHKTPITQGCRVSARASEIRDLVWAAAHFEEEDDDELRMIYGTATASDGRSNQMKWRVQWDASYMSGHCNTPYSKPSA